MYTCQCGKTFEKANSLNAHYSHCAIHKQAIGTELSPNRVKGANKGKMMGWDKFDEDRLKEIYAKSSKTLKEKFATGEYTGFTGKTHTDETKQKIREKRVKVLSDGLQHGAFKNGTLSYLETWFSSLIDKNGLSDTYSIKYNYHVYPYFLDFAFTDLKIDFELDGKFHYTYESNINHDKKRNEYLESKGWKVYRISIDEVNKNPELVEQEVLEYIKNFSEKSESRYYGAVAQLVETHLT